MRDVAKCLPQHEHCPENQVCNVSTVPKEAGGREWLPNGVGGVAGKRGNVELEKGKC